MNIVEMEKGAEKVHEVIVGYKKTGDGSRGDPIGFRVLGLGSEAYRSADRQCQIMNVQDAAKRKDVKTDLETYKGAEMIVDGSEIRRQIILNHCLVGWFGFTDEVGEAEFTPENVARVFKVRPTWPAFIVAAIEDEANFIEG